MKSSNASTRRIVNASIAAALLLAFCTLASSRAAAQRLLSVVSTDHQQPSTAANSSTEPQVMTPELYADLFAARQHYDEAIAAYRRLPENAQIDNKIGMAYQRLHMIAAARSYYGRAIKLDRKYAPAYNNLGTIEYHDKDLRHAERLYRRAIKLEPKTAQYWSNLGAAYLARQKYHDGAEAYQRAFVLDPDIFQEIALNGLREATSSEEMAKMYLVFAGIFAQAGLKTEALDYLRKAFLEGVHDKNAVQQDQQFASLHGDPAFEQLFPQHRK